MKSTGVIKKMDELGRIVIPKEMRRILNIRDGEVLELFVSDDNLVMKKHESFEGVINSITRIIDIFDEARICKSIIVDKEKVLVSNISDANVAISDVCKSYIINREELVDENNSLKLGENLNGKYLFFCPLITDLDVIGGVILVFDEEIDEEKKKIGRLMAKLITNCIGTLG